MRAEVGFVSRSELAKDYKNDDASLQAIIWSQLFDCSIKLFQDWFAVLLLCCVQCTINGRYCERNYHLVLSPFYVRSA